MASRQPGGELVYLDRLDARVNLRGFRIELGEVEAALRRDSAVRDAAAVVVSLHANERSVVAAVVPADPSRKAVATLAAQLVQPAPACAGTPDPRIYSG